MDKAGLLYQAILRETKKESLTDSEIKTILDYIISSRSQQPHVRPDRG